MPRFKTFGLLLTALLVAAALSAAPAFAEEARTPQAPPAIAAAAAPAQPACGQTVDLAAIVSPKAGICPAKVNPPQDSAPELKGGRSCRCSCGQPCRTDADCGPGGICAGGITCC
jgi:hypothetical protein